MSIDDWQDNGDGTWTVKSEGAKLWDIYGKDWKEKSGYTGDPTKLQIGDVVGKKENVSDNQNASAGTSENQRNNGETKDSNTNEQSKGTGINFQSVNKFLNNNKDLISNINNAITTGYFGALLSGSEKASKYLNSVGYFFSIPTAYNDFMTAYNDPSFENIENFDLDVISFFGPEAAAFSLYLSEWKGMISSFTGNSWSNNMLDNGIIKIK
jgi:hypothetical protein